MQNFKLITSGLLIFTALIIAGTGCQKQSEDTEVVTEQADPVPILTYEEASGIANTSTCLDEGELTDTYTYNGYTDTWWIDMIIDKPGCAPACVVYEETKTAEINWRCTGAIIPH